jgi:3',5'-cyclic AMP phosphodiesterase CpdA
MSHWRQLTIAHLSDLHFGPRHRFQPPIPPDGHAAVAKGWPKLLQLLERDWWGGTFADRGAPPTPSGFPPAVTEGGQPEPNARVMVALTGDLTETASDTEFADAKAFARGCAAATITGWTMRPQDLFVVPGNHDLLWDKKTVEGRWLPYCNLHGSLTKAHVDPGTPQALTRIVDQSSEGLIVAEINSCAYIERGVENRGQVDQLAIATLRDQLDRIEPGARDRAIKVALMHHHPVHLPGLAESSEGYSALVNSNALLERLRDYGFHLILHGHKHTPFTFWYDPACAWISNQAYPLMIAAGGTAGSTELSGSPGATNTYNMITLRWDPLLRRVRILVETRGLVTTRPDNAPLDPDQWHWRTLRVSDRHFELPRATPPGEGGHSHRPEPAELDGHESPRQQAIHATRRNFPVVEILPSLDPRQGNEARVRIEGQVGRDGYEVPTRVEWWAGPSFEDVVEVKREDDPTFGARFTYWGPVLIQARLHWPDGASADAHVFAPLPSEGTAA